jgi:hypothetical protein
VADDQPAFAPQSQSEYAFPASADTDDDVAQADQRNQQIQSAFDQQRFQRNMIQSLARSISRSKS